MQFMKLGKYTWPVTWVRRENDNVCISYIITDKRTIGKTFNNRNKGILSNVQIIMESDNKYESVINIKTFVITEYYTSYSPAHNFYSANLSGFISDKPAKKWRKVRSVANITKHKI